jgi:hypothetical protein
MGGGRERERVAERPQTKANHGFYTEATEVEPECTEENAFAIMPAAFYSVTSPLLSVTSTQKCLKGNR